MIKIMIFGKLKEKYYLIKENKILAEGLDPMECVRIMTEANDNIDADSKPYIFLYDKNNVQYNQLVLD